MLALPQPLLCPIKNPRKPLIAFGLRGFCVMWACWLCSACRQRYYAGFAWYIQVFAAVLLLLGCTICPAKLRTPQRCAARLRFAAMRKHRDVNTRRPHGFAVLPRLPHQIPSKTLSHLAKQHGTVPISSHAPCPATPDAAHLLRRWPTGFCRRPWRGTVPDPRGGRTAKSSRLCRCGTQCRCCTRQKSRFPCRFR